MKKVLRVGIVLLVVLAMVLAVAKRKKALKQAKPYGMRPVMVRVVPAKQGAMELRAHYVGVLEPWQVARISSRVSARVDQVLFREGDRVEKGEVLVKLDDKDLRAQIKEVAAQMAAVKSTLPSLETNKKFWEAENDRDQKLAEQGVISPVAAATTNNRKAEAVSKYLSATGTVKSLESKLANLKTKLEYTRLTAPFDGVVSAREVDPGDLTAPGKPLMVVEDRSSLKIVFDAPQADLNQLKEGQAVQITREDQQTITEKITRIYPSLDSRRMARVEVQLKNSATLRPGAFLPLEVVLAQESEAVTVPRESLMQRADGAWVVFVVEKGALRLCPIERGLESGGRVAVSGLNPGAQVVTSTFLGWANLADGLKVEVAQ